MVIRPRLLLFPLAWAIMSCRILIGSTMHGSFNEYSRVVTKHVLGESKEFEALQERLAMCEHARSRSVAAALGYLIAKAEQNNKQFTNYDKVLEQVEDSSRDGMARNDAIFTEIYYWLDENLDKAGYDEEEGPRQIIADLFAALIVPKATKDF